MARPMARPRTFVLWLVPLLAIAGGVAGWQLWTARADTQAALPTQTVTLGHVEDTVSALGALQPLEYVDVGTQVSGQLQKIHVAVGEKVEKGQLLAEIDPTVYQSRANANEAQLLNLRAQILERQAHKRLVEQQLKRQKQLLDARATSQESYDIAEAALNQVTAQIAALDAQVKQTQSTLNGDLANLRYTKIYAPMAGTIVSLTARQGQTLNANQSAPIILRVADLDTMTVWTQVSEADIPKLRIGMTAYFTTLGRTERRWYGMLRQVLPTPDVVNNVVLYNALFDVPNPDHDLLPQMSAQVFFVLAEAKDVPVVPVAALRRAPGRGPARYTARVLEGGAPVERPVQVGVTNRLTAEIRAGLKPGDEVVLEPMGERRSTTRPPRVPRL